MLLEQTTPSADIASRLASPRTSISPEEALTLWRWGELTVTCPIPRDFIVDPSLPGRIRGALGNVLIERMQTDAYASTLFELMFKDGAEWQKKWPDLPRPFAVYTRRVGQNIKIRFRLFGFACAFTQPLARFLEEALLRGISLNDRGGVRPRLTPIEIDVTYPTLLPIGDKVLDWACLIFSSPVSIRQGEKSRITENNMTGSMIRRVSRMAHWQDLTFNEDILHQWIEDMEWHIFNQSRSGHQWSSKRQNRSKIVGEGDYVTLVAQGRSHRLWPILQIAEILHIGARTAFGYGACRIFSTHIENKAPDIKQPE